MSNNSPVTTYQRRSEHEVARIRAGLRNGAAFSLLFWIVLIGAFFVLR